ncbi:hypothetical protein ATO12_20325 [Aquimarina atlantica]|uniref:Uncharacterized protein n=1 Tax=Aquimarina atlantica TaxID=1317122 RepID=A0A023BTS9_9FLAO|nr:DUF6252 family protein [Aquimarina atlantica]EZH73349.1 hypothetical protein ATO12_20325 [Aquimarina atlantica]
MKRIWLIVFVLVSVFTSCKSDDDTPLPENTTFVKAQVDASAWEATSFKASYINNIVSIEANRSDGTTIDISVQNVSDIGDYTLGNVSIGVYEEGSGNDETYTTSGTLGSGTINFSVLKSDRVEGTFSFDGGNGLGNSKSISNGVFKINAAN